MLPINVSQRPPRAVGWTSTSIANWLRAQIIAAGGNPSDVPDLEFRLMRIRDVKRIAGLSTSTIYRLISEGSFPRPIKLAGASGHERAAA